jgi:molybdenum cofactor biosynthesis enzyme MoaA
MDLKNLNKLSLDGIKRICGNMLKRKIFGSNDLKPLMLCYYVNYDCNFSCQFCSRKEEVNSIKKVEQLSLKDSYRLLEMARKSIPAVYFTGGEPLLHPHIEAIVQKAKELKFNLIALNTNGSLLNRHWEILDGLDVLVVSLHSLNEKRIAKICGVNEISSSQIIKNIEDCAKLQKLKKFKMTINCVITPDNIPDVYEILDFCLKNNLKLSIVPEEGRGCMVNNELKDNPEYKKLIEHLIKIKKSKKGVIFNSTLYLEIIQDLSNPFSCIPSLLSCVAPDGQLYYPCPEISNKIATNILHYESYDLAAEAGKAKFNSLFGKFIGCAEANTFKAAHIEPLLLVENPLNYLG